MPKHRRIFRHVAVSTESNGENDIACFKSTDANRLFKRALLRNVYSTQKTRNLCHLFQVAKDKLDAVIETI